MILRKKKIMYIGFLIVGIILVALIPYFYRVYKSLDYSSNVYNIVLKGKVLDKDSNKPIENAKIFLDYSYFIGPDIDENDVYKQDSIVTDRNGNFELKIDTVSSLTIRSVEKINYKNIELSIIKLPQQDKTDDIVISMEHYK